MHPHTRLYAYLSTLSKYIYVYIYMCVCVSVRLSVCENSQPTERLIYVLTSVCKLVCICLSIYLSAHLSIYVFNSFFFQPREDFLLRTVSCKIQYA